MKNREIALRQALNQVPESPRHVIPRSMLLSGQAELFAPVSSGSFAIYDANRSTLAIIGSPEQASCLPSTTPAVVVAVSESFDPSSWTAYRWKTLDVLTLEASHTARLVASVESPVERLPTHFHVSEAAEAMRFALGIGLSLGPVFAVREQGKPIAAACCFWRSENYYDISIDTLPEYRRRGFGRAAATALIGELAPANAVHCSSADEVQARRFIQSLGFHRVGTIRVGAIRES